MKITLFSTIQYGDWNLFKNWKRVLCYVVLVNYLVSRCLVSSECVAEAQYCCWFSFGWAWQCVTQRKFNSTIRGNICTRPTSTHTHTNSMLLWTGANKRKSENLLLHSNLNGLVFARERDDFFCRKHHRKLVEADSLCWMCVKYVLCLGKEKMGEKKALNIYINNFVRHSPHKSLIYMGIWLYFWVFKFKRCFVWNFILFST